jgi:intein/homing endonuclease
MPVAPVIDGSANTTDVVSASSFTITLSTSLSNDVIIVCVNPQGPTVTAVSSPTLGNFKQLIVAQPTSLDYDASIWYAIASAPLSSETITVTLSGASGRTGGVAFGVNGTYLSAPFDPNMLSLNGVQQAASVSPNITINISTTNPDDLIIGFGATANTITSTLPSVMTDLVNVNLLNVGYYSVNSIQTNLPLELTTNSTGSLAWIVITLTADPPPSPPPSSPAIDGAVYTSSTSSTMTVSLTTTNANDIIVVVIKPVPGNTVSSVSSPTVGTYKLFLNQQSLNGSVVFYGIASQPLVNETITIVFDPVLVPFNWVIAFGVSNAFINRPFDPAATESTSLTTITTSTSLPNDLIIVTAFGEAHASVGLTGNFSYIPGIQPAPGTASDISLGYLQVDTLQTNLTYGAINTGSGVLLGMNTFALTSDPTTAPTPLVTQPTTTNIDPNVPPPNQAIFLTPVNTIATQNYPSVTPSVPDTYGRLQSQVGLTSRLSCTTRGLKNIKFLFANGYHRGATINGVSGGILPNTDSRSYIFFDSAVSGTANLNRVKPEGFGSLFVLPIGQAEANTGVRPVSNIFTGVAQSAPNLSNIITQPVFNGTIHFFNITYANGTDLFEMQEADVTTYMGFLQEVAPVINQYCKQYGNTGINVDPNVYSYHLNIKSTNTFDNIDLAGNTNPSAGPVQQGLVDRIANIYGWAGLTTQHAIIIVGVPGVTNTDCDPANGYLGYHDISAYANIPFTYIALGGEPITPNDIQDYYQVRQSHEIAEMTVDPLADLVNPEVCDMCVAPGEILLGDNKPIEEYNIGDKVLGVHQLQSVQKTYIHDYDGELFEIKALGMLSFKVTDKHPMMVVPGVPYSTGAEVTYLSPRWKNAGDIIPKLRGKAGDYLVMPKIKGSLDIKQVEMCPGKQFTINKDTAWLLGLYVAEGSIGSHGTIVSFSLSSNEENIFKKLDKILLDNFDIVTSLNSSNKYKSMNVIFSSHIFAQFFNEVCGHKAANKKIPDFILYNKDEEILKSFLDGYIDGNGSVKKEYRRENDYYLTTFVTVSKILAQQLQLAYGRLGIFVSLRVSRKTGLGVILGRKVNIHETYRGQFISSHLNNVLENKSRIKTMPKYIRTPEGNVLQDMGEAYLVPVKKISRIPYTGKVYNIQTTNHTFLISNVASLNCGPNCQTVIRDFFDSSGNYISSSAVFFPPGVIPNIAGPGFNYAFMINSIVQPSYATLQADECQEIVPFSACGYNIQTQQQSLAVPSPFGPVQVPAIPPIEDLTQVIIELPLILEPTAIGLINNTPSIVPETTPTISGSGIFNVIMPQGIVKAELVETAFKLAVIKLPMGGL